MNRSYMKAKYMKPVMRIITIQQNHCLMAGSEVAIGNKYDGGDVLSREKGNSFWEDED